MLPDGAYDVVVVDASSRDDGTLALEVAILAGASKGEVVAVRATGLAMDEIDVLGTPGTLTVAVGEPRLVLEH